MFRDPKFSTTSKGEWKSPLLPSNGAAWASVAHRNPEKVTASLIEAGVSGAIVFWHDTWSLGNGLQTVFDPLVSTAEAARENLQIRASIDVARHSRATRVEMLDTFNPHHSVTVRTKLMVELVG